MKALSPTEQRLVKFCDDERQALALAPFVSLSADATDEEVQDAVIVSFVKIKEAISGVAPELELVSGQRRDLIRKQLAQ